MQPFTYIRATDLDGAIQALAADPQAAVVAGATELANWLKDGISAPSALIDINALPLAAIPISFGYCVARYQVLQIDVLLKRNLSYALLSALVWAPLYLAPGYWLGTAVGEHFAPPGLLIGGALATLAIGAFILWRHRHRFRPTTPPDSP